MIAEEQSPLATFVDRHTLVYDRWYPHDIDLVWKAVSTAEDLDVWMLPESRVDRRVGGGCRFGWGGSADAPGATKGTVTEFSPPTAIQYSFDDGASFMRFDLAAEGEGTRLRFMLHYLPDPNAPEQEPWTGGDLPAGRDTAWRPGFVAGFHEMLDDLGLYLRGEWTAADRAAHLDDDPLHDPGHVEWVGRYRAHIRDTCPRA